MALEIGLKPMECEQITIYELNIMVEVYRKKQKDDYKNLLSNAFFSAYFSLKGQKGLSYKDLEEIFNNMDNEKKTMSDDDMLKKVKMLHKQFGGV